MLIHHDDSIMDRQSDDTFGLEGYQNINENIRLLTGPLYEEGLDIPLRSLCIDVVLIEYPQQHTSTRCPLKDYPWTNLRSHLG